MHMAAIKAAASATFYYACIIGYACAYAGGGDTKNVMNHMKNAATIAVSVDDRGATGFRTAAAGTETAREQGQASTVAQHRIIRRVAKNDKHRANMRSISVQGGGDVDAHSVEHLDRSFGANTARKACPTNDKWPDCTVRIANFEKVGQDYCESDKSGCQKTCCEKDGGGNGGPAPAPAPSGGCPSNDKLSDCASRIANFKKVGQDYCETDKVGCQKSCCEETPATPPPPPSPATPAPPTTSPPPPSPTPPPPTPAPPTTPSPSPTTSPSPPGSTLLRPFVSNDPPDATMFEKKTGHYFVPAFGIKDAAMEKTGGPVSTNKFWGNWIIKSNEADGNGFTVSGAHEAIFPSPYTLKWKKDGKHSLEVCNQDKPIIPKNDGINLPADTGRILTFEFQNENMLSLGTVEAQQEDFQFVNEHMFGVDIDLKGANGELLSFPIFSGMAYVSGRYQGGFTPELRSSFTFVKFEKQAPGVWKVVNQCAAFWCAQPAREMRVYVLDKNGELTDQYQFSESGVNTYKLDKPLEGWIRIARVIQPSDRAVLDSHAEAILDGFELELEDGLFRYRFATHGREGVDLLHWAYAHQFKMMSGARTATGLTQIRGLSKGLMHPLLGSAWEMRFNTDPVANLGFVLPTTKPPEEKRGDLLREAEGQLDKWKQSGVLQPTNTMDIFSNTYYFAGKGFQKVGTICLILEQEESSKLDECVEILANGFKCLYDGAGPGCTPGANAPPGLFYDEDWGGVVTKTGYNEPHCAPEKDFGNACYNDHHYHYGYYIVAASILAKLSPATLDNKKFVHFVNMLCRDTANPSADDTYFPRFRNFDWYDLHSWSRGLSPNGAGKDQESVSEEVNFHYSLVLWGKVSKNNVIEKVGNALLTLGITSTQEFFMIKAENPHYPREYKRNLVSGMFLQRMVYYGTWFPPWCEEHNHGIQMLPLSDALRLAREPNYVEQEWNGVVGCLDLPTSDAGGGGWSATKTSFRWTSILLTGTLSILDPEKAYPRVESCKEVDDGLTKAWALYWTASLKKTKNVENYPTDCDIKFNKTVPPEAPNPADPIIPDKCKSYEDADPSCVLIIMNVKKAGQDACKLWPDKCKLTCCLDSEEQ